MRALILLITASLAFAQTPARPEFEVATIKLDTSVPDEIDIPAPVGGRFHFPFNNLRMLIATAYNLKPFEILGGPAWIASNRYDVEAKSADPSYLRGRFPPHDAKPPRRPLHAEGASRNPPTPLVRAGRRQGTPKLTPTPQGNCGTTPCGMLISSRSLLQGRNITMQQFVASLTNLLGSPVTDNTNYTAPFDLHLEFTREGAPVTDDSPPSIFTAIQEQLGLRLEAHKAPAEVLVVDHAEKPTDN